MCRAWAMSSRRAKRSGGVEGGGVWSERQTIKAFSLEEAALHTLHYTYRGHGQPALGFHLDSALDVCHFSEANVVS